MPLQESARMRAALEILADRANWTPHGLEALAVYPLIYGHFNPIELASDALARSEMTGRCSTP